MQLIFQNIVMIYNQSI